MGIVWALRLGLAANLVSRLATLAIAGGDCNSICYVDGPGYPCTQRIQWVQENLFASHPDACTKAHGYVLQQCSDVCALCTLAAAGCVADHAGSAVDGFAHLRLTTDQLAERLQAATERLMTTPTGTKTTSVGTTTAPVTTTLGDVNGSAGDANGSARVTTGYVNGSARATPSETTVPAETTTQSQSGATATTTTTPAKATPAMTTRSATTHSPARTAPAVTRPAVSTVDSVLARKASAWTQGFNSSKASPSAREAVTTSSACDAICGPGTCRALVHATARERFADKPDACALGLTAILEECTACATCSLTDTGCSSPGSDRIAPLAAASTTAMPEASVRVLVDPDPGPSTATQLLPKAWAPAGSTDAKPKEQASAPRRILIYGSFFGFHGVGAVALVAGAVAAAACASGWLALEVSARCHSMPFGTYRDVAVFVNERNEETVPASAPRDVVAASLEASPGSACFDSQVGTRRSPRHSEDPGALGLLAGVFQ